MTTPVEQYVHPKTGVTSFTRQAAQRAMDAQAAKWGAPAGYYSVGDRAAVIDRYTQVWTVRVRLFAGAVRHNQTIVFEKEGRAVGGNVRYRCTYQTFTKTGGKAVELFKLSDRYPSSLEAAIRAESIQ